MLVIVLCNMCWYDKCRRVPSPKNPPSPSPSLPTRTCAGGGEGCHSSFLCKENQKKKNSGAHSRVATRIQPSFQKKNKKCKMHFILCLLTSSLLWCLSSVDAFLHLQQHFPLIPFRCVQEEFRSHTCFFLYFFWLRSTKIIFS